MLNDLVAVLASSENDGSGVTGSDIALYIIIGIIGLAVIAMIIFTNVSRKKQAKRNEAMLNSLVPGDVIETGGGIIGSIVSVREASYGREFVIETGEEGRKTTLTVDVQALYRVIKQKNPPPEEKGFFGKSADETAKKKADAEVISADVGKPDEVESDGKGKKRS